MRQVTSVMKIFMMREVKWTIFNNSYKNKDLLGYITHKLYQEK